MTDKVLSDSNPYRRNLLLICTAFLIYHFAGGQPVNEVKLGLIGLKLTNPDVLYYFAMALLLWTGYRYYHNSGVNSFREVLQAHLNDHYYRNNFKEKEVENLVGLVMTDDASIILSGPDLAKYSDLGNTVKM